MFISYLKKNLTLYKVFLKQGSGWEGGRGRKAKGNKMQETGIPCGVAALASEGYQSSIARIEKRVNIVKYWEREATNETVGSEQLDS